MVVVVSVCLAGQFIWMLTSGAEYEKTCNGALLAVLFDEYVGKTLLPSLVLKEPYFHCYGGLF